MAGRSVVGHRDRKRNVRAERRDNIPRARCGSVLVLHSAGSFEQAGIACNALVADYVTSERAATSASAPPQPKAPSA